MSLMVASLSLTFTQNAFTPGDTPQKAWNQMAAGMWVWFFAQVIFGYYKIVLHQNPYPSLADLFFVIAYLPLFLGLLTLIKNFRSTGLPMGTAKSYMIQGLLLLLVYAAIFYSLLWKLITAPNDTAALKFLNFGYPTFDFILIAATSILIRISWELRGGSLAKSWIFLCAGFTLVGIADIMFAYQTYTFLDIVFFSGYFLIALAGLYQLEMLRA